MEPKDTPVELPEGYSWKLEVDGLCYFSMDLYLLKDGKEVGYEQFYIESGNINSISQHIWSIYQRGQELIRNVNV